MGDLALYLAMAVMGYFAGGRLRRHEALIQWTARLQTAAIIILIFTMGMRMGANPEVVENLNSIGLYAFVMTVCVICFSVGAITAARKFMKIDRQGNLINQDRETEERSERDEAGLTEQAAEAAKEVREETKSGKVNSMTIIILICVIGGIAFGHFGVPVLTDDMNGFAELAAAMINIGLCVLLFFVGFDMGVDGTVITHFRQVGWRVLAFPFIIMAGTLLGAGVCTLFLPELSLRETLAVGAGFGWYSFAPGIIMEAGYVTASAVSFMHNVMRELISVLIIPLVARKTGYVESMAVCGCSSMDVCLPIIERSTRGDIAAYGFINGVIQSMAVPVLVPLIIG